MMPMVAMPAPMMTPANLLRLETVDIRLRDHRGLYALHLRGRELPRRRRRQWRGIRDADKRCSARGHSDRKFQNRTIVHPIVSFYVVSQSRQLRGTPMNAR